MAGADDQDWIRNSYDLSDLNNEAERIVERELARQLSEPENSDVCRQEECILDMLAYALNHVTPLYRTTLMGRLYAPVLNEEHQEEVRQAVRAAIERVRANPPS
jgi:competence protein ComFB